jgi:hypothetical protein
MVLLRLWNAKCRNRCALFFAAMKDSCRCRKVPKALEVATARVVGGRFQGARLVAQANTPHKGPEARKGDHLPGEHHAAIWI